VSYKHFPSFLSADSCGSSAVIAFSDCAAQRTWTRFHFVDIFLPHSTHTRLVSLLVLSVVLVSPVAPTTQGVIAVLAVLAFVLGFAFGLGAGTCGNL
jgi:hydrogenase/urease accessory protein HupE